MCVVLEQVADRRRRGGSFRHTHAKVALETGRQLIWLSRRLGHSSLKVTSDVYGYFGAKERKAEAELMEGVFGDHAELAELRLQPVDLGPQPLELAVVLVALAGRERWADQAELNEAP